MLLGKAMDYLASQTEVTDTKISLLWREKAIPTIHSRDPSRLQFTTCFVDVTVTAVNSRRYGSKIKTQSVPNGTMSCDNSETVRDRMSVY